MFFPFVLYGNSGVCFTPNRKYQSVGWFWLLSCGHHNVGTALHMVKKYMMLMMRSPVLPLCPAVFLLLGMWRSKWSTSRRTYQTCARLLCFFFRSVKKIETVETAETESYVYITAGCSLNLNKIDPSQKTRKTCSNIIFSTFGLWHGSKIQKKWTLPQQNWEFVVIHIQFFSWLLFTFGSFMPSKVQTHMLISPFEQPLSVGVLPEVGTAPLCRPRLFGSQGHPFFFSPSGWT